MNGAIERWPTFGETPPYKAPTLFVLEKRFAELFDAHESEIIAQIASVKLGTCATADATFKIASKSFGKNGALYNIFNDIGQCARFGLIPSESWEHIAPLWYQLYDGMTEEERLELESICNDLCCGGRCDPTTHLRYHNI